MWLLLIALPLAIVRTVLLLRDCRPRAWSWWLGWSVPALALAVTSVVLIQDIAAQKLVSRLLMPLDLLWLGLLSAGLIQAWRRRWWAAGLFGVAFALLTFSASGWVADRLMTALEQQIPRTSPTTLPAVEAVFVLGGGTDLRPDGEPEFGVSGDRLAVAAAAYLHGRTPLLVASGSGFPGLDAERNCAAETAHLWRALGVPAEAIIELPGPLNTVQEIAAYRELCATRGWTRIALVTSAWHLPRALALCHRAGLDPLPLGADWRGRDLGWSLLNFVPTGQAAATTQLACWEWLGLLRERLRN